SLANFSRTSLATCLGLAVVALMPVAPANADFGDDSRCMINEIKSNVEDNGYIQLGKGAVAQSRFSYGRDCQRSTSSIVNNNIAIGDKSDASKYTKSENDIYNNDYVLKEA